MKTLIRFKCYHLQYKLGSLTIMIHQRTRKEEKENVIKQLLHRP